MQEQCGFEVPGHFVDQLGDGLGRIGAAADLDGLGRAQELVGDAFDFRRQGSGEQQCLTLLRQDLHDPPHVRQEPHVQHAFGFVEHEEDQTGEIG